MPRRQRHDEIYLELRAKILDGTLPSGAALPTFAQLGAEHGVSVATVNKAMAKLKADSLVKAVRGAGVFVAAALKPAGHLPSIGVVLPELSSGIYLEFIQGMAARAEEAGFHLQLCHSRYDPAKELALLESLLQSRQVKGVVLSPCGGEACLRRYEWLRDVGYPLVFADRYLKGCGVPFVTTDSAWGARAAVGRLVSLGHSRIAFLSAEDALGHQWCQDRLRGYKDALAAAGVAYDAALVANKVAAADVEALLGGPDAPTALFLASNRHLHRVLEGVELGGGAVAVAGFDEVDGSIGTLSRDEIRRFLDAPLIKVIQPFAEIGAQAVGLLVESIRGGQTPPRQLYLAPKLVFKAGGDVTPRSTPAL